MLKLLLTVLLLSCSARAFASCAGVPKAPDRYYADASAVFVARITELKEGEYHFTRGKAWKGNAPAEFVVPNTSMTDVQSGAEYIVYASDAFLGKHAVTGNLAVNLFVGSCNRTRLLQQSRLEARHLDALQAGRRTDFAAELSASLTRSRGASERAEAARLMQEVLSDRSSGVSTAALAPAILRGAKDRNLEVRLAAVSTLRFIHTRAGLDARIAALRDSERAVRAAAILAVYPIPEGDSRLFQALVAALKRVRAEPESDEEKQQALLYAFSAQLRGIAATGAEKDQAVKLLRELIDEIKESWQISVPVRELGMLRERARESAPQLLRVLKSSDHPQLTEYTITALADIGAAEMRAEIEPYIKDEYCSVAGAAVTAVWTLDKAGFNRFFVEKGAPEMRARFERCGDDFMLALQKILPAGRELEPLSAARRARLGDTDDLKDGVKQLLDSWRDEL